MTRSRRSWAGPAVAIATGVGLGGACRLIAASAATTSIDQRVASLVLLAVAVPAAGARLRGSSTLLLAIAAGLTCPLPWLSAGVSTATAGIALAIRATRRRGGTSGALASALAVGWLLWPIWLAPALSRAGIEPPEAAVTWHPVFAADVATGGTAWVEQAHTYQRTPLGNDLAIRLPRTSWSATAAHFVVAIVTGLIALARARWRTRRASSTPIKSTPQPTPPPARGAQQGSPIG